MLRWEEQCLVFLLHAAWLSEAERARIAVQERGEEKRAVRPLARARAWLAGAWAVLRVDQLEGRFKQVKQAVAGSRGPSLIL